MIEVKQEVSIKDMNLSEITSLLSSDKQSNNIVSILNLLMVSNFAIKVLKISNENDFTNEIEKLNQINEDITNLIDKNNEIIISQNDINDKLIALTEIQYQVIINIKNILDIINKNSSKFNPTSIIGLSTVNYLCEGILNACNFIISLYLANIDTIKSKELEDKIKNVYIDLKIIQLER